MLGDWLIVIVYPVKCGTISTGVIVLVTVSHLQVPPMETVLLSQVLHEQKLFDRACG